MRADRPKDLIEATLRERAEAAEPGEVLPSTGSLMTMFKVSHNTVRRVQKDLSAQGVIRRTPSGDYVRGEGR